MKVEVIQSKIYEIRGLRVMLDFDLATLYQAEKRALNQAVKRKINRFPLDFMFQLTKQEWDNLKSQFVISSWGGARHMPYAFTEQGLAMLSSVLNSDIAINVNIQIMRAFVEIREFVKFSKSEIQKISDLSEKMKTLEDALYELSEDNQKEFDDIYLALAQLAQKQKLVDKPRRIIGYNVERDA